MQTPDFPGGSDGKVSASNAEDLASIPVTKMNTERQDTV